MVDSLIQGYNCPSCSCTDISEKNIDVVGAAGNTINIDMQCPSCKKHYMARMEVVGLDLSDNSKFSQWNISDMKMGMDSIKNALSQIKEKKQSQNITEQKSAPIIKDTQIVKLSKDLKNTKLSAEDLFNQ